jgi:hypothetical protein
MAIVQSMFRYLIKMLTVTVVVGVLGDVSLVVVVVVVVDGGGKVVVVGLSSLSISTIDA